MRVAVCISGLVQSNNKHTNLIKNNLCAKRHFGQYDFYYATYHTEKDKFESTFPNEKCLYLDEPEITYHPYELPHYYWEANRYESTRQWIMKGGPKRLEWSSHHYKQILTHARLCDTIKDSYDVVVRLRFDSWISRYANFEQYVKDSFDTNTVFGFSATKHLMIDKIREFDSSPFGSHYQWIVDQCIIHPVKYLNLSYVEKLYKQKRLHPAEMGWWQVLSKPNHNKHRCFDGYVNHDKNVYPQHFYEP